MDIYGIITGDVVGSTKLNGEDRNSLIEILKQTIDKISSKEEKALEFEMYRGDSFQVKVAHAKKTLRVALLIRLGLIAARENFNSSSRKNATWDARLSIGIGSIDFVKETINISDGEAFRLSGRALDSLSKIDRLTIRTSNQGVNDEFAVECFMADTIMKRLSANQAKTAYSYLLEESTQKFIAEKMNLSPQAVNKSLQHGGMALHKFIERFETLIERF